MPELTENLQVFAGRASWGSIVKKYIAKTFSVIKFVNALPQTGESQFLYCVPQNETDKDGYTIVILYVWNDTTSAWNSAGAFSMDIDPNTLLYKTDKGAANGVAGLDSNGKVADGQIPFATSSSVGGIKQSFDPATGTWVVITEDQ